LHTVLPGRIYRCSQPSGRQIERLVRTLGIRTIINLRGGAAPQEWYMEESRATERMGICQEDICLSAGRLPSVTELRHLVELLDHTEYPILFHCQRGADRTGFASAVAILLQTDADLKRGLRQLGMRYGHFALGRPANLDRFFDQYAAWLGLQGLHHTPAAFRRWIEKEYTAGPCLARLECIGPPANVRTGVPFVCTVRAHNIAAEPWHLRPGTTAGIHLVFAVFDEADRCYGMDRAGLFQADVPPGGSIDLTLAVAGLPHPGHYRLRADMLDEQQCNFHMTGSEPLEMEFDVAEQEAAAGGQRGLFGLPGLADRLAPGR
jgi:protein tyrosine phosphatase (PTP) superfamily phosphohydrolase (DUF442 family)